MARTWWRSAAARGSACSQLSRHFGSSGLLASCDTSCHQRVGTISAISQPPQRNQLLISCQERVWGRGLSGFHKGTAEQAWTCFQLLNPPGSMPRCPAGQSCPPITALLLIAPVVSSAFARSQSTQGEPVLPSPAPALNPDRQHRRRIPPTSSMKVTTPVNPVCPVPGCSSLFWDTK